MEYKVASTYVMLLDKTLMGRLVFEQLDRLE